MKNNCFLFFKSIDIPSSPLIRVSPFIDFGRFSTLPSYYGLLVYKGPKSNITLLTLAFFGHHKHEVLGQHDQIFCLLHFSVRNISAEAHFDQDFQITENFGHGFFQSGKISVTKFFDQRTFRSQNFSVRVHFGQGTFRSQIFSVREPSNIPLLFL